MPDGASLEHRLQAMVGKEYGPVHAWDPVNAPMIRHWCEAAGIPDGAYLDPGAPLALRHGGPVAPPAMLQTWLMPGLRGQHPPGSHAGGSTEIIDLLAEHGYRSSIGVNLEQEYLRYLRPGDQLHGKTRIAAVSALKETSLGAGYFVTLATDHFDQDGALVGTMAFRQLVFRPNPQVAQATTAPGPAATVTPAVARAAPGFSSLRVGQALPPLPIPVTLTSIVAGAIATRDYHPVHHDAGAAQALGMPTIFMNILTTSACIERYVTEWAGAAVLLAVSFKLGTPNFAGDCMTMRGQVNALADDGTRWLELGITGENSRGLHVSAIVRLRLPQHTADR